MTKQKSPKKEPFLSVNERFAYGLLLSIVLLMQVIYWIQDLNSLFFFVLQILFIGISLICLSLFILNFFITAHQRVSQASANIGEKGNVTKAKLWGFDVNWKNKEHLDSKRGSVYILSNLDLSIYEAKIKPRGEFLYTFEQSGKNLVIGFYRQHDPDHLLPCSFEMIVDKKRPKWQKELMRFHQKFTS